MRDGTVVIECATRRRPTGASRERRLGRRLADGGRQPRRRLRERQAGEFDRTAFRSPSGRRPLYPATSGPLPDRPTANTATVRRDARKRLPTCPTLSPLRTGSISPLSWAVRIRLELTLGSRGQSKRVVASRRTVSQPCPQADRFSRFLALIWAMRMGPSENSPSAAFRVNSRK